MIVYKRNANKKNLLFKFSIYKYLFIIIFFYITSKINNESQPKIVFIRKVNNYNINFTGSLQFNNNNIFFNLTSINYYFSYYYNQVEFEYCFCFYDQENNLIFPSDLSLYYNLHFFCILKSNNINLQSISDIHQNKFFCCLEYYELNNPALFEVKICENDKCTSINISDCFNFNFNS